MIKTKKDLHNYLNHDAIALGRTGKQSMKLWIKHLVLPDYILKFQRIMRFCEYHKNNSRYLYHRVAFSLYYKIFTDISLKLGFSIPLNVFGPGLAIVHYGTIVVSANAKIGANCRIHPSSCIGASGGFSDAPVLGNNVYIGPGVKIYGGIQIGNNIAIAANAAVNKSFTENDILIGGVPAVKIKNINIHQIIKHINHDRYPEI